MVCNIIVQVTSYTIRLIDCQSMQLLSIYHSKSSITLATGTLTQIIFITLGSEIIYLELNIKEKCLELMSSIILDQDIACLSMTPLNNYNSYNNINKIYNSNNDNNSTSNGNTNDLKILTKSYMLAVGMWTDDTVRLLSLPSLIEMNRIQLQIEIQARDVLLVELENIAYLMIGLGDGRLITYNIEYNSSIEGSNNNDSNNNSDNNSPVNQNKTNGNQHLPTDFQLPTVTNRRCGVLGKHPVTFNCFYNQNKLCIFAICDHPTIIYSKNNKLLFSVIDSKQQDEFIYMTSFHCELFPESLALCSESSLLIGIIDTVQKVRNKMLCLY